MRSLRLPSWIKKLLGFGPVAVPPHVFAVEEGALRYGRFVKSNGRFELKDYRVEELPSEVFTSGPLGGALRDQTVFGQALEALVAQPAEEIREASLVVPDAWLRITFSDFDELPRSAKGRDDVLRWKLRRLVPFRVEELRIGEVELPPLPGKKDSRRMLLGFGVEQVLNQLEEVFGSQGIRVGSLSNESLSLLPAVQAALRDVELGLFALVSETGYSLLAVLRGAPVLHRFKSLQSFEDPESSERLVGRDLKMTRAFLAEELSDREVGRVLLVAPDSSTPSWSQVLERAFDLPAHPLAPQNLGLSGLSDQYQLREIAPLFGAASQEVA